MEKYEIISGMLQAFDELERVKSELANLREIKHAQDSVVLPSVESEGASIVDATIFTIGRKHVFNDALISWNRVSAEYDEDGRITVMPFDRWLQNKVRQIPDFFSRNEFMSYFETELSELYESEKKDAIEQLKYKESN